MLQNIWEEQRKMRFRKFCCYYYQDYYYYYYYYLKVVLCLH